MALVKQDVMSCSLEEEHRVGLHVWCLEVYATVRQAKLEEPRRHIDRVFVLLASNRQLNISAT